MSLLGIDIGTTGCKAIAFDLEGRMIAQAYREYALIHPQPGWSELDINELWQNVSEAIQDVNTQVQADPVKTLSISCQGEAVTAMDSRGQPLCNFSVSFDHRTIPQAKWWQENLGAERLFKITGMPLHAMHSINKIMWYKENHPELYTKTVRFLCVEDFINYKLTGVYATDWSLAARTMTFDIINKCWSDEILQAAGVDKSLLPPAYLSATAIGRVSNKIAGELGFLKTVIVATGGHDQPCGALGAGITEPGIAMNAIGTSDVICPAFAEPILSDKMLTGNYSCYPHVTADRYVSIAFNLTGGLLLRWYRDNFCQQEMLDAAETERNVYDIIIKEASSQIKSIFFLPHFVGAGTPYLDSCSRGALVGLTIDTTKQDISRAVLDSANYEMKLNIDLMNEASMGIKQLRAIGGGAKSTKWLQMKADTLALPVSSMQITEAASLGAAILAGISVGVFKNAREAVDSMVRIGQTYYPDAKQAGFYAARFQEYKMIYPALKNFNKIISGS